MKLWCTFLVLLILTIAISYICCDESVQELSPKEQHTDQSQSSIVQQDRLRVKRSPRNANILYRYCRQSGLGPPFCLKYAVQMILATGH